MATTYTDSDFLRADKRATDLALQLGALKADLAKVAKERDRLKVALLDLEAANARTEATIDSVKHQGLRRLLWIARDRELEELIAAGNDAEALVDLAGCLLRCTDACEAESLVGESLGIIS